MPSGQLDALAARLAGLDDAGRKTLVKPMRAYSRSGDWDLPPRGSEPGLTLVGAAVLPDVRSTAAWLRRFPPSREGLQLDETRPGTAGHLVSVLTQRNPSWLPGLVEELANRFRFTTWDPSVFDVLEGLRRALALPPPESPAYVAEWVWWRWAGDWQKPSGSAALRQEPEFAQLVPLIFSEDGIAERLRRTSELAEVVRDGLVDRDAVLDAAVDRLQRGGRPKPTNDFVAVLEGLAPTSVEVADRLADYLALLPPGTASTVAASAQAALLSAYDAGTVSGSELLSASSKVLARSEKRILRTQLGWLEKQVADHPGQDTVAGVSAAAAVALSSEAVDVRQRAEALLHQLGSSTALDDNRAAAAAAVPLVPAPQPTAPVTPIESLDEAVEQFLVILRTEANHTVGIELERVLEALPRLAGPGREALRAVRHRFADEPSYQWAIKQQEDSYISRWSTRFGMAQLAASLVGDPWDEPPRDVSRMGPPQHALTARIVELALAVHDDPRVRVVSLPTDDSGALDPDVLAARLAEASSAGWTPAPLDLEQAWLRADPALHPAPIVTIVTHTEQPFDLNRLPGEPPRPPTHHTRASVVPASGDVVTPGSLWSTLTSPEEGRWAQGYWSPETYFALWPLLLPHQPDCVAAHLLPELGRAASARSQGTATLVRLADSPNAGGPAIHAAIALALNSKDAEGQAAGVDALLALAARHHLDGTELGNRLAAMVQQGDATPKRLPAPLQAAARAGAAAETWAALHRVLKVLLSEEQIPTGMVDLLTAAAAVADLVPDPQPIEGLERLSGSTTRSRQVAEAKRLAAILHHPS